MIFFSCTRPIRLTEVLCIYIHDTCTEIWSITSIYEYISKEKYISFKISTILMFTTDRLQLPSEALRGGGDGVRGMSYDA